MPPYYFILTWPGMKVTSQVHDMIELSQSLFLQDSECYVQGVWGLLLQTWHWKGSWVPAEWVYGYWLIE